VLLSGINGTLVSRSGSHTIGSNIVINTPLVATVNPGSTLTHSGDLITNDQNITKAGGGTLAVKNILMLGAGTTNGAVTASGGTLKVLTNGTDTGTSKVKSLSIAGATDAWTATLDLGDNDMIVDYSAASPLATLTNQIKSGRGAGAWTGTGINSSAAAADPNHLALAIAEATQVPSAAGGTFSGQAVDTTAVLIKFTYAGDTDLDGDVDVGDLGTLASAWQTNGAWINGDFDYDGAVGVNDLGLLASNWQAGVVTPLGPSLAEALAAVGLPSASVPEPAGALLLAVGGFMASRRRRK
jgi:hypothetical protein